MNDLKIPDKLGNLKGVYHVKISARYLAPLAVLLIFAPLPVLALIYAPTLVHRIVAFVFSLIFVPPIIWVSLKAISALRDELSIYSNGFAYKSRKGIQICLWSQVKDRTDVLDFGNRPKVTSVKKRNREKILFAYGMRGLDVIANELDRYEFSQIPESEKITEAEADALEPKTLGELKATYHVKNTIGEIVPLGMLLLVAGFGAVLPIANNNVWLIPGCSLPLAIPFCLYLWQIVRARKDELKIYENGFTYLSRKGQADCLWHEIEDYSTVRRKSDIASIKKVNGPWITIARNIQGTEDLMPHLRTVITYTGPES